jgi:DNA-binding transcriptional MerR regulator
MKLISKALAQKGVSLKDLPSSIQLEVEQLQQLIAKYNEACDEYDEEEDKEDGTEQQLDEMEDYIAATEKALADKIIAPSAPATVKSATGGEVKKSGTSAGWLIFGGVVLIATVGMVNVFKNK